MTTKIGSLFDGSGGFPLAATLCGFEPVWASEVESYPIAVTRSHFPNMIHLGDVSKVNGADIEPVDVITFGSPCQDMSIAGKRAGIKHTGNGDEETTRSGLFMEAVRIIKEMREATNDRYPTFAVWENVPGAFSSNKGEDFRLVLEELIKIKEPGAEVPPADKKGWPYADLYMGDGWSLAYRTFDAQYWGVPQRRRRIYLVADFRGQRAGQVLFESEGLSGYSAEGRTPWQRAARDPAAGAGAAGICLNDQGGNCMDVSSEVAATLWAEHHGHPPCVLDAAGFYTEHSADSRGIELAVKVYGICSKDSNAMKSDNPKSGFYEAETSRCLDANGGNPTCNQGGMAVVVLQDSMIGRADKNGPQGSGINEDVSFTLDAADRHAVAYCMTAGSYTQTLEEQSPTLMARDYKDPPVVNETEPEYIVRRLTPTECARLQGFPDEWGKIEPMNPRLFDDVAFWRQVYLTHCEISGKSPRQSILRKPEKLAQWHDNLHTDSAEYKMWGNGIALPNALYVMQGIADALIKEEQHG